MPDQKHAESHNDDEHTDVSTAQSASSTDKRSTESHLEFLSLQFVAALNDRSWEAHSVIIEHASPDFTGDLDTGNKSAAELLDSLKSIAEQFPEMAINVKSCNAYFYPQLSKADVYIVMETVGHPPGVSRDGFCQLEWELVEGKWMCVRHKGFPGWGSLGQGLV